MLRYLGPSPPLTHSKTLASSGERLDPGQRNAGREYVHGTGFMARTLPFIKMYHGSRGGHTRGLAARSHCPDPRGHWWSEARPVSPTAMLGPCECQRPEEERYRRTNPPYVSKLQPKIAARRNQGEKPGRKASGLELNLDSFILQQHRAFLSLHCGFWTKPLLPGTKAHGSCDPKTSQTTSTHTRQHRQL